MLRPEEEVAYILESSSEPKHSAFDSVACKIHQHLVETWHSVNDIDFMLVEKLPINSSTSHSYSTSPTRRARLESRWIDKLQAELNGKRKLRHFLPGGIAARGEAANIT